MPAKKKKKKAPKKKGAVYAYLKERDAFYKKHPNARLLIGLLIVAFALLISKMYYKQQIASAVSFLLSSEYDINYIPE